MKYVDNILTFKDWSHSMEIRDGRRWRFDEGPESSTEYVEMVPIDSPYDQAGEGPAIMAGRKVRELLFSRVSRPEKGYITRVSYTRAVSQYHPGGDVPLYSGSSLQRKKRRIPRWIIRMNKYYRMRMKGKQLQRPGEQITWATVGDKEITCTRHSNWDVNRYFETVRRTRTTWQYQRYIPGLHVKARQKIYTALSATGFSFLPDVRERDHPLHYFISKSKNKFQENAKAFWRANPGIKTLVTLTFIEHIEDGDAVKLLNKFLTVVRRELPGVQDIWVAEHQPENPKHTIHFHLIFNRRLNLKRFNPLWVLEQYNAGLRGHRSADGSEITMEQFVMAYNNRKVGQLLNPFQVEMARSINRLSAYLIKYVTKADESEAFGCSNWHCSRRISRLFTRKCEPQSTFRYLHSFKNYQVDFRTGECKEPITFTHQFFSMVKVHNSNLILPAFSEMEEINQLLLSTNWSPGLLLSDMQITQEEYYKMFVVPDGKKRNVIYRWRDGRRMKNLLAN